MNEQRLDGWERFFSFLDWLAAHHLTWVAAFAALAGLLTLCVFSPVLLAQESSNDWDCRC